MSDARPQGLPADVAREVPVEAERAALETVWSAMAAARSAPAVSAAESSAMWAAIVAGTTVTETSGDVDTPAISRPLASPHKGRPVPTRANRPAWARRRVGGVTLAVTALVIVAMMFGRPGAWREVQVPRGQQQVVLLPDGSAVTLSASARLRYREDFRGWFGQPAARRAELEGTAYFAVEKDGRPFTVRTYNAEVRVLGTEFEVQAWPAEGAGTAVAVAEGRVALAGSSGRDLTLAAGDRAMLTHEATTPTKASAVAVERVAPWRRGGFVAVDEPLASVVASLERQFDVTIDVEDGTIRDRRITLYYPDAALDRVLGDLATMQALTIERRRDGYLLRLP